MDVACLAQTPLFRGSTPEEVASMLACLGAVQRAYQKGAVIYCAGDTVQSMGLILSGSVHIESGDVWGNRSILDQAGPRPGLCRDLCLPARRALMVSVTAAADTQVLFLQTSRVFRPVPAPAPTTPD